jgi:NodT family efflux transporter outer membrane factor (OMF) lipoprotein
MPITLEMRTTPTICKIGYKTGLLRVAALLALTMCCCGCTPLMEYVQNGFKVGPNYRKPAAEVASNWIDASDKRVRTESDDLSKWWTVFNDPILNDLICYAYNQNLTLREAGYRVLQARAQLAIAVGAIFPQSQAMTGDYLREASSGATGTTSGTSGGAARRYFSRWDYGFTLSWELDFWGRFRRAIESNAASLDASVEDYDDVLVTLLSDVATTYVTYRTTQERIKYATQNANTQADIFKLTKEAHAVGKIEKVDVDQAESTLYQTKAGIPELEITLRTANNQLCILLGMPPEQLRDKLGAGPIPSAPAEVAVGIPADLLRRRPDVRRAERLAAAQSAQIGVAESQFYPHITIDGTIDYQADRFRDLFGGRAFSGSIGPSFRWDILQYGRLLNNVRLQQADFYQLVEAYKQSVLNANQDVENGLVTFLRAQERYQLQKKSVDAGRAALDTVRVQYQVGKIDFTRVDQLLLNQVVLEDTLAQIQGEIATGLIAVYKGLGGGWEIPLTGCTPTTIPSAAEQLLPPRQLEGGTGKQPSSRATLGAPEVVRR